MSHALRVAKDRLLPLALAVAVSGCASDPSAERLISITDFSQPPADLRTDVVEMSKGVLAGPEVVTVGEVDVAGSGASASAQTEISETLADGERVIDAVSPKTVVQRVPPGGLWPVDALVGQVNGRPVFADEFFGPIEDQLRQIAANPDRVAGREQFVRTIRGYFKQTVDSELIVAEAESQLSPEQQQGVLAWLKSMQEATIAERGGSRAAAEASLQAEEDKTLDEFMQQRREVSLALRLLNQRIEPRAIVSWREVEQAYQRDAKIYNPPSQVRIGRIKLDAVADAAKIERVRALVKEGKKFSEIAKELDLSEGGVWQASELPAGGVQALPLADGVLSRLKPLQPDQVSEELVQKEGFVVWFAIMEISQPRARSIYDRDLQLAITRQIQDVRRAIERQRYIASLRSRWVTDDIVEMEERLVGFALERYWR
ncbi:MAG: hypothetical protein RLZZ116_852 [Planctomycetota bacterium]|jgi:hypothetical protein